ncbi:MAG: alpha/beta fold hydrolase, partial [Pseudomonadota bacterium]
MKGSLTSVTSAALLATTAWAGAAFADLLAIEGGDGFPATPTFEEAIDVISIGANLDMTNTSSMTVDKAAFGETFSHHRLPGGTERIHFAMGGEGPAMLLRHGWPTSWYEWVRMMLLLAEDETVIVPDLPGVRRSPVPSNPSVKRDVAETVYSN